MINFDSEGLIVQTDGDGGDCAARSGEYCTGAFLAPNGYSYTSMPFQLLEKEGVLLRYTRAPYNDPSDCSRDQTLPMVIAAGYWAHDGFLRRLIKAQLKRFTLFQNRDICTPEHFNVFIRSLYKARYNGLKLLWPLLLLGDAFNLINSIALRVRNWYNSDDVGDGILHAQIQVQAATILPTPLSWLSRKIFGSPQKWFDQYHRPESGGNPLNEVWRPIFERYY